MNEICQHENRTWTGSTDGIQLEYECDDCSKTFWDYPEKKVYPELPEKLSKERKCESCDGSGFKSKDTMTYTCPDCRGSGCSYYCSDPLLLEKINEIIKYLEGMKP